MMMDQYIETGGLRWGASFWGGMNATWPFAKLQATSDGIVIVLNVIGMMKEKFEFSRDELKSIRKKRGIFPFNTGVVFEHAEPSYPPFILFWTFRFATLKRNLTERGFTIEE